MTALMLLFMHVRPDQVLSPDPPCVCLVGNVRKKGLVNGLTSWCSSAGMCAELYKLLRINFVETLSLSSFII